MPLTVTHSKVKFVGCQQAFEIIGSPSLVSQTRSLSYLPHRARVNCLTPFQIFFFLSSVVLLHLSGQRSKLLSFLKTSVSPFTLTFMILKVWFFFTCKG